MPTLDSGDLAASASLPFCYLTTRGRRTGRPHTVEIWFAISDGVLYLMSGRGDRSDWVRNAQASPDVRVRLGEHIWAGTARMVSNPEEDGVVRRFLASKYQGWSEGHPLSSWAQTALPVAIDLRVDEAGR
jgi:deazaflavin-dependent oxidoreductase (nitroreductase family)